MAFLFPRSFFNAPTWRWTVEAGRIEDGVCRCLFHPSEPDAQAMFLAAAVNARQQHQTAPVRGSSVPILVTVYYCGVVCACVCDLLVCLWCACEHEGEKAPCFFLV